MPFMHELFSTPLLLTSIDCNSHYGSVCFDVGGNLAAEEFAKHICYLFVSCV